MSSIAAFDTVDCEILLQHLQTTYGISDVAHRWFRSYVLGRSQYVRIGTSCSSVINLICGVPQGSVLGPVLFILYTAGLISLIESHGLTLHLYADDTQVYGSCSASAFPPSSLPAPVLQPVGCSRTDFSLVLIKLKFCGVRRRDASTSCQGLTARRRDPDQPISVSA